MAANIRYLINIMFFFTNFISFKIIVLLKTNISKPKGFPNFMEAK